MENLLPTLRFSENTKGRFYSKQKKPEVANYLIKETAAEKA